MHERVQEQEQDYLEAVVAAVRSCLKPRSAPVIGMDESSEAEPREASAPFARATRIPNSFPGTG